MNIISRGFSGRRSAADAKLWLGQHLTTDFPVLSDLRVRVGLKETADPVTVCYCFGFIERMLFEEVQTSGHSNIASESRLK